MTVSMLGATSASVPKIWAKNSEDASVWMATVLPTRARQTAVKWSSPDGCMWVAFRARPAPYPVSTAAACGPHRSTVRTRHASVLPDASNAGCFRRGLRCAPARLTGYGPERPSASAKSSALATMLCPVMPGSHHTRLGMCTYSRSRNGCSAPLVQAAWGEFSPPPRKQEDSWPSYLTVLRPLLTIAWRGQLHRGGCISPRCLSRVQTHQGTPWATMRGNL